LKLFPRTPRKPVGPIPLFCPQITYNVPLMRLAVTVKSVCFSPDTSLIPSRPCSLLPTISAARVTLLPPQGPRKAFDRTATSLNLPPPMPLRSYENQLTAPDKLCFYVVPFPHRRRPISFTSDNRIYALFPFKSTSGRPFGMPVSSSFPSPDSPPRTLSSHRTAFVTQYLPAMRCFASRVSSNLPSQPVALVRQCSLS